MMNPSISWQFALQLLAIWFRGLTTFEMKLWSHSRNIFHSLKVNWNEKKFMATLLTPHILRLDFCTSIRYCYAYRMSHEQPLFCWASALWVSQILSPHRHLILSRPRARLSIAQWDLHNQSCYESSDDQLLPKIPPAVCIRSFHFLWLMANRFIATYLTTSQSDIARALQYLGPIIESRIAQSKRPKSEQGEMPVRQSSLSYLRPYIDRDDRTIWSAGWLNPQHTKVNLTLVRLLYVFWW